VLIGFPLVFLAAVCNRFAVMIARNYLMIAPFCGLLLARAVTEIYLRLPWPWARRGWAFLIAAAGAANAVFLVQAAESIRSRDVVADLRRALSVVASRPGDRVQLSGSLASLAKQHHIPLAPNVTDRNPTHVLLWVRADGPDPVHYPDNNPFGFEAVFGPREVNVGWYPTWVGADHIALMTIDKARAIRVPFVLHRRR